MVPLSLMIIWSASTTTTFWAAVSPSSLFISAPVVVIALLSFILGEVRVLFVKVCVPVGVTTEPASKLMVSVCPDPLVEIPVPPAKVKVWESRSTVWAPPVSP